MNSSHEYIQSLQKVTFYTIVQRLKLFADTINNLFEKDVITQSDLTASVNTDNLRKSIIVKDNSNAKIDPILGLHSFMSQTITLLNDYRNMLGEVITANLYTKLSWYGIIATLPGGTIPGIESPFKHIRSLVQSKYDQAVRIQYELYMKMLDTPNPNTASLLPFADILSIRINQRFSEEMLKYESPLQVYTDARVPLRNDGTSEVKRFEEEFNYVSTNIVTSVQTCIAHTDKFKTKCINSSLFKLCSNNDFYAVLRKISYKFDNIFENSIFAMAKHIEQCTKDRVHLIKLIKDFQDAAVNKDGFTQKDVEALASVMHEIIDSEHVIDSNDQPRGSPTKEAVNQLLITRRNEEDERVLAGIGTKVELSDENILNVPIFTMVYQCRPFLEIGGNSGDAVSFKRGVKGTDTFKFIGNVKDLSPEITRIDAGSSIVQYLDGLVQNIYLYITFIGNSDDYTTPVTGMYSGAATINSDNNADTSVLVRTTNYYISTKMGLNVWEILREISHSTSHRRTISGKYRKMENGFTSAVTRHKNICSYIDDSINTVTSSSTRKILYCINLCKDYCIMINSRPDVYIQQSKYSELRNLIRNSILSCS